MTEKKILLLAGLMALSISCASKTAQQEPTAPADPASDFVEPEIGEADGIQGYEDVVLTAEDERLSIPGEGKGKVPPMKAKGKKSNLQDPSFWPRGEGIAGLMEELVWGMSVKKVFSIFEKKIKAIYEEQMKAQSGDLLAEDRIRTAMTKELNKVKNSYVAYNGQTTGYESHMVSSEFMHNNGESMLVWDAGKYVEYLFFINDRFWKRVRLFRIDELGGITLEEFNGTIEAMMGAPGQEIVDEEGNFQKIVWRDEDTYAAILDGSKFFGVYGLRLSAAVTETNLDKLRTREGKKDTTTVSDDVASTIERAVTSVDMDDHQESVIDQYTGKSHNDGGFGDTGKQSSPKKSEPAKKQESKPISDEEVDSLF